MKNILDAVSTLATFAVWANVTPDEVPELVELKDMAWVYEQCASWGLLLYARMPDDMAYVIQKPSTAWWMARKAQS